MHPPIGIVLCSGQNETHVEYTLGGLSNQVFVSHHLLSLPTEKELAAFVRQTRHQLEQ
jgi:hypothetical protein